MKRIATVAAALLLITLFAAPAPAQQIAVAREMAVARFVADLEALVAWCDEAKLYRSRDLVCRTILAVDPEHSTSREFLKFRKNEAGEWVQVRYREPKNYNEELEPEFEPRFQGRVGQFAEELLTVLDASDPKEEPFSRGRAIADILAVDPDNLRARRHGGEDRLNGKWVLIETVTGKARGKELREMAKDIRDSIPDPAMAEPTEEEGKLGVSWKAAYQGIRWRGLGGVGEAELRLAVRTLDAAEPLFNKMFGLGEPHTGGSKGFYLLSGKKQAELCLTNHPSFDEGQKKYFLQLKAAWIPGRHVFFQWNDSSQLRLDGATRNALSLLQMRSFGMSTKHGWGWEGLGLYIDYLLTGSRRTIYVTNEIRTTTDKVKKLDIDRRMKSPGSDWMRLARDMLEAAVQPDLRTLVLRDVNDMTAEDLVYSYALVTFIIEGRPKEATQFFSLQGGTDDLSATVEHVFDMAYKDWEKRFERWLRETTDR